MTEIHTNNRRHNTDWDRACTHQCRPKASQEYQQYQDCKHCSGQHVLDDRIYYHIDVDTLIHHLDKTNISVIFFQFCEFVFDLIRHRSGGIARLLLHRQHHTRMVIDRCIDLITVIRHHHICHIRKRNWIQVIHMQIQHHKIIHVFHTAKLISHSHQEINAIFCHIACRHHKILGCQDIPDQICSYQFRHICLIIGGFLLLLDLIQRCFNLLLSGLQLGFSHCHLNSSIDLCTVYFTLCTGQLALSIGHLFLSCSQLLFCRI